METCVTFVTLRGLVLFREISEFGPAFRHRNQKRGAFDRNATPSGASGAVGGACSALVRADHSLTPIAPIARWLRS